MTALETTTGEEGLRATSSALRGSDREQRDGDSWDWDCRVRCTDWEQGSGAHCAKPVSAMHCGGQ